MAASKRSGFFVKRLAYKSFIFVKDNYQFFFDAMKKIITWLLKTLYDIFFLVVKIQDWYSALDYVQKNNVTHNFHKGVLFFGWLFSIIFIRAEYKNEVLIKDNESREYRIKIYDLEKRELQRVMDENIELKLMQKDNQKREIEIAVLKEQLKNKL